MARVFAIDYGTKRVGLAVTDPLQLIASPLDTIHPLELMDFIKKYLEHEAVECFVLGWPKNLDNSDTEMIPHVKGFHRKLLKEFPHIPVHLVDERFTSKMALNSMIQAGSKKKDRRQKTGNLDKVSATIILQSYLESKEKGF
ncbi:MAG: Holliday junction resolvase RuvX [Flammeovirgaceae bacterium]